MTENLELIHDRYGRKFEHFEFRMKEGGSSKINGKIVVTEGPADPLGLLEIQDILEHLRKTLQSGVPLSKSSFEQIRSFLAERHSLRIGIDFSEDISGAAT